MKYVLSMSWWIQAKLEKNLPFLCFTALHYLFKVMFLCQHSADLRWDKVSILLFFPPSSPVASGIL